MLLAGGRRVGLEPPPSEAGIVGGRGCGLVSCGVGGHFGVGGVALVGCRGAGTCGGDSEYGEGEGGDGGCAHG